jgi:cation diffusion facilitator family transporter
MSGEEQSQSRHRRPKTMQENTMADPVNSLTHDHIYLGADHQRNEKRVWLVIALTTITMVVEIAAGTIFGSLALTADGWHMSTHAGAMLIAAIAYSYARRHANDPRYSFGTGKLGDLAAFASAVVLALVALFIGWESLLRLAHPVEIDFNQAILVAVIGLVVNLLCAFLLRHDHSHHGHGHGDGHGGHHHHDHHVHDEHHGHAAPASRQAVTDRLSASKKKGSQDNNMRAAYIHVLADALTSVLAILALVLGRAYGWTVLDPLMGVVGGLVIARWSWGLIKTTSKVLLDRQSDEGELAEQIRKRMEANGDRISDLHVWQVGPGHHAAIIALMAKDPQPPSWYKARLGDVSDLSHVTVEVTPLVGA